MTTVLAPISIRLSSPKPARATDALCSTSTSRTTTPTTFHASVIASRPMPAVRSCRTRAASVVTHPFWHARALVPASASRGTVTLDRNCRARGAGRPAQAYPERRKSQQRRPPLVSSTPRTFGWGDRDGREHCPARWPARQSWSPAARAASAARRPSALRRSALASGITGRDARRTASAAAAIASEAAAASAALRHPHRTTAAPHPSTPSRPTCRRRPKCAGSPTAVLEAYPRLDVLVNNVGGFWATRHATADGLEHTYAVNVLAPFLLTELLLDRLKASAPAAHRDRVVGCAADGTDRLRRPAGRARLFRADARTTSRSWRTSCSPSSSPGG